MGGSVAGGLGGAALGGLVGGPAGIAVGATLGGLAGQGISNLGAPSGSGTSGTPSSGTAQIYQPQNQPGADQSYQQLLNQLYQPSSYNLPTTQPVTQVYPQFQSIVGQATTPSQYGGYGSSFADNALVGAWNAMTGYNALQPSLSQAGAQAQAAGLGAIPQVQGSAFNPLYNWVTNAIANDPYTAQAYTGAQQAANIGGFATGNVPSELSTLQSWAGAFPQIGQTAAGTTLAGIPQLQSLGAGAAGLAPSLSGQAAGLSPQLQQLYSQIVPSLIGAGGQYAAQAGATTPELQALQQYAPQLAAAAPGYAGQAAGTNAQLSGLSGIAGGLAGAAPSYANQAQASNAQLQGLSGIAGNLAGAAPSYAGQASSLTPYIESVLQGGTIPQSEALAGRAAGLANQNVSQLASAYAPLQSASNQILQTGFDPQQQLYNRTATNVLDQQRAINAMSGVANTPYGAGVTGNTMANFNIDWQNQQLAREAQAGSSAAGLTGMLPGFQAQGLSGLAGAQGMLQQPAGQALSLAGTQQAGTGLSAQLLNQLSQGAVGAGTGLAGQQLAGTTAAGNLLNQLSQGAIGAGTGLAGQELAGTLGGANVLNQLTQGGGNLAANLSAAQLANTLGGAGAYNNLLSAAGGLGGQLTAGQLANLTGAGNLYGNLAGTAGNLAGQVGGLAGAGVQQQISPIQAAQGIYGGNLAQGGAASQLAAQAAATPQQAYQQQQQALLQALGAQTGAAGTGVGALGSLTNQLAGAGNIQTGALTGLNQFGQLPYATQTQQQQNALNALTQQAQLGQAQYQLPQQVMQDLQSYLRLGQSASLGSGTLGNLGAQQLQTGMLGAGLGLGMLGNSNLFGSGANTQNFMGTGMSAGDVAATSADPTMALAAYNAANSGGGLLGGLSSGLSNVGNWVSNLFGGGSNA